MPHQERAMFLLTTTTRRPVRSPRGKEETLRTQEMVYHRQQAVVCGAPVKLSRSGKTVVERTYTHLSGCKETGRLKGKVQLALRREIKPHRKYDVKQQRTGPKSAVNLQEALRHPIFRLAKAFALSYQSVCVRTKKGQAAKKKDKLHL